MMNSSLVVQSEITKANLDIAAASGCLTKWWDRGSSLAELDHRDQDVHSAVEALMRALASVSNAVERLAELPACDGSHSCDCAS